MSYPHPKRNFVPKTVLMKTGMRPVNAAKPKAAYNAVKRNRWMHKFKGGKRAAKKKKNQEKSATKQKDREDEVFRRILSVKKMKA
ncbi:hypothetical protein Tco_0701863 [Tanacetum coccineum]|uniref:Uncharacterized protein n=1 Tax=Tanacetum coccineum TaxID=301880 RepID=A0ABQ4XVK8_9ASTR